MPWSRSVFAPRQAVAGKTRRLSPPPGDRHPPPGDRHLVDSARQDISATYTLARVVLYCRSCKLRRPNRPYVFRQPRDALLWRAGHEHLNAFTDPATVVSLQSSRARQPPLRPTITWQSRPPRLRPGGPGRLRIMMLSPHSVEQPSHGALQSSTKPSGYRTGTLFRRRLRQ